MDERNGKNPLLALTVATVLFAALGVMVYTQAPYKGIRPSVPPIQEPPEKIRARLWQDPFQAVLDGVKAEETKSKQDQAASKQKTRGRKEKPIASCVSLTAQTKPRALAGKLKELKDEINTRGDVTVLGVMVLGEPYDADIEFRIRQRYAILSALNVLGFHPDDPTHIDFLQICPSPAELKQGRDQKSLLNIIPFEWLISDDQKKSILLLWLNDESFKGTPLTKLGNLTNSMQLPAKVFKIMGPATSTTLLEMIKENTKTDLEIYSATATADNDILVREAKKTPGLKIETSKFLDKINRTILPDQMLAEELSKELKNRGISGADHIVLVAEWDTDYGRLLPQRFKDVFKKDFFKNNNVDDMVHRFSYLRGIDGKLPGEQNGSTKEQKKEDGNRKEDRDIKKLEEPVGKSQYDYLRRLADRIGRLNDKLERDGQGSIKAIGVLGNDFYDKYLVLQALGQRFPDRIFFTTDLDARYLHPANIGWTRNLIVASSFGLKLHEDLQGDVPPFRDSYQTSTFWATWYAFSASDDPTKPSPLDQKKAKKIWPSPHIYEIGRHNAIDLTGGDNITSDYVPVNQGLTVQDFPKIGWERFLFILATLSILGMVFWLSFTWDLDGIRSWKSIGQIFTNKVIIACLLSFLLFIFLIFLLHNFIFINPSEEPLYLTEGISAWPAEFIRLIATALSYILIFLSLNWLEDNTIKIHDEFCLGYNSEKNSKDTQNVNQEWATYLHRSTSKKRLGWIVLILVIYLVLCGLIITTFGPPASPVRGYWSGKINTAILVITVLSFLFLTFFILDTILLCQRFIANFYDKLPRWNPDSLYQFTQKWIKDSDLPQWSGSQAEEALSDWMFIQLIARRTDVVGKLIFFPFIVWSLMFISRHYYFDNWRTPLGLAIVISLSALLAWGCAVYLRHSAEKLRTVVSNRLAQRLIGAYAADPPRKADADRIQYVLNEVKGIKTGAFASYVQQPVLQSLLVPLGGISGVKILELLANLG